jgi:hypothetical protein
MALRWVHAPFALSLSKGLPSLCGRKEGEGFDKLSPNGFESPNGFPFLFEESSG